ncbi:MAG: hypothetical protein JSV99_06080 [Planctomycetota bacterium]|nr:MAG: hypothetical protein JSV99_06080 [Planctomycetota bacterium]
MAENQTDQPSQHATKKTSPLKVALIIFALVLALLILKLVLISTEKPTISVDYVAEFNRITRPADYDPNQNAATYYQKAFDALTRMPAHDRKDIWRVLPTDMNEAQIQFLESWLQSNSQAINYLNQAIQQPYHWVQARSEINSLGHIDLSYLSNFREAAYCLQFQSKLYAATHEIHQAFESALHMKQMAVHLYDPKMLIAQLLGMAVDGLATQAAFQTLDSAIINSKTLARFQSQLEQVPQPDVTNSFQAEKLSAYNAVQSVFTDDGTGDGRLIPHKLFTYREYLKLHGAVTKPGFYSTIPVIYLRTVWASLNHPTRRETLQLVEEVYELLDQLAGKTPWQMSQQGTSYDKQLQDLIHHNYFVRSRFARRGRMCEIYHRCIATNDALITTIAILRYKADHNQFPDNLDQLVSAGYMKELPMDPYSPGPLTYKRIGNDFKLYSLGSDFDDDGGTGYNWGHREGGDQPFWPIKRPEKNKNQ